MAYYAKSLTTLESYKEKNYLNQACADQNLEETETIHVGCRIAGAFKTNDFESLYSQLKDDNFLEVTLKYELSRILNKESEIAANFNKLDAFNDFKPVRKYQVIELLASQVAEVDEDVADETRPAVAKVEANDTTAELPNALLAAEENILQNQKTLHAEPTSQERAPANTTPAKTAVKPVVKKNISEILEQRIKIMELIEGL